MEHAGIGAGIDLAVASASRPLGPRISTTPGPAARWGATPSALKTSRSMMSMMLILIA